MFRHTYLLAFLFFIKSVSGNNLEATKDIYTRFVNYTEKQGLCNNIINDIIQDADGFIWFATDNGLSRFDGYTFVNFYHSRIDSLSLPGNVVTSLAIDDNSKLWVGTTQGLCNYNLKNGVFTRYPTRVGDKNSPRINHIRKILYSGNSVLWVETLDGTLSKFIISKNKWEHYNHDAVTQPYYRYHALFQDNNGDIWLGGRNTPIMKFNVEAEKFTYFLAKGDIAGGKRDNDLADIFQTSNNDWFVVATDGIYEFSPSTEFFDKIWATSTFSITEDSESSIWFGTGNGLMKMGTNRKLVLYQNNANNPFSLTNNHVNKVFVDRSGNIWVGTQNGVSLLSKKNTRIKHFFYIPGATGGLSSNHVTALAQHPNGLVYIGTSNEGLNVWNPEANTFSKFKHSANSKSSIASNRISNIYIDKNSDVWIGLWAGVGFNKFEPEKSKFTRYALDYETRKRDWYNAFIEDNRGNFWVGAWGANGLMEFDREKEVFTDRNYITYDKPYNRSVTQIVKNGDGLFFFLSNMPYIFLYSEKTGTYSSIFHSSYNDFSYNTSNFDFPYKFASIYRYATNRKGTLLLATDEGIFGFLKEEGFFRFNPMLKETIDMKYLPNGKIAHVSSKGLSVLCSNGELETSYEFPFETSSFIQVAKNGLAFIISDSIIYSIESGKDSSIQKVHECDDKILAAACVDSTLYVGTREGLVKFAIRKDSLKKIFLSEKLKIIDLPVSMLLEFSNNSVLAFTSSGIFKIDSGKNEASILNLMNVPETFSTAVKSAEIIDSSFIWLGTENGHYKLNVITGELEFTNLPGSNRLSSHLVSSVIQDSNGNIWVGTTDNGLNKILPSQKILHFYEGEQKNTIPSNNITAITETSDGRIWIGTDKGLSYIRNGELFQFDSFFSQKNVKSIIEGLNGFLWVATVNEIVRINTESDELLVYDESMGFPESEYTKAALMLNDSNLMFGTTHGFVVFNPANFEKITNYPNGVKISQFDVYGEPFQYSFTNSDTVELNFNQNFFQVNFTSFDFGEKPSAKYFYKLDKVDDSWVETDKRYTSYTNVQPGKYVFRVTSQLANGLPSANYASLTVIVKPPFWNTYWFRTLIALLIAGSISVYLWVYIRQLKSDRRNVELEQKLLISQMNPHFIFNSLTAIQSFMYNNNPEEAGNYLSSFSRLVRLILESSRSTFISLTQEIQTLELYLDLQMLRFPNKFEYEINIDDELLHSNYQIPPLLAQPFIENSIEHGIMGIEGKGIINIHYKLDRDNENMTITVEDNGIGIDKSMIMKSSKRLSHTSRATEITRERIKNISYKRSKGVGVNITDLSLENKQGTRVSLCFRIKK